MASSPAASGAPGTPPPNPIDVHGHQYSFALGFEELGKGFAPMMPNHASLILFFGAAVVLLAIPGPAVLYIVGRSIGQGRSAGLVSALGIGVGTLVHVAAAAVGLSALLMSSAMAFGAVKYLGAAYLIYLGVQKLRRRELTDASPEAAPSKVTRDYGRVFGRIFAQGIIVNVLNPKTALFFFAFLPQFVDASRGSVAVQISFLGALFAVMGVLSDSLWALFAGSVAHHLKNNPHWMKRQRYVSGGMLMSSGVATAFAGSGSKK
jgi:threonine/homoserine/homoserine lactone efflux protein